MRKFIATALFALCGIAVLSYNPQTADAGRRRSKVRMKTKASKWRHCAKWRTRLVRKRVRCKCPRGKGYKYVTRRTRTCIRYAGPLTHHKAYRVFRSRSERTFWFKSTTGSRTRTKDRTKIATFESDGETFPVRYYKRQSCRIGGKAGFVGGAGKSRRGFCFPRKYSFVVCTRGGIRSWNAGVIYSQNLVTGSMEYYTCLAFTKFVYNDREFRRVITSDTARGVRLFMGYYILRATISENYLARRLRAALKELAKLRRAPRTSAPKKAKAVNKAAALYAELLERLLGRSNGKGIHTKALKYIARLRSELRSATVSLKRKQEITLELWSMLSKANPGHKHGSKLRPDASNLSPLGRETVDNLNQARSDRSDAIGQRDALAGQVTKNKERSALLYSAGTIEFSGIFMVAQSFRGDTSVLGGGDLTFTMFGSRLQLMLAFAGGQIYSAKGRIGRGHILPHFGLGFQFLDFDSPGNVSLGALLTVPSTFDNGNLAFNGAGLGPYLKGNYWFGNGNWGLQLLFAVPISLQGTAVPTGIYGRLNLVYRWKLGF